MIKILLVDDDYSYLRFLRTYFATTEIDAHVATSAEDALNAVKERSFDMVLTDQKMLGIDGLELAARIKENDKEIPVIMMTFYLTPDLIARAQGVGISNVFDKGISLPEIAQCVREHAHNRHFADAVFAKR